MKVDLESLDFRDAKELIDWCVEHRIDYDHASLLWQQWYTVPGEADYQKDLQWTLDVPEEHMTYFLLKW